VTIQWHPHQTPVADYGRGVVTLAGAAEGAPPGGVPAPLPRIDTLVFRSRPDPTATIVGLLLIHTDTASADHGWRYAVAGPGLVTPNLVEFGYEESGVPIDSVTPDGRWSRGRLGTDRVENWLAGWVDGRNSQLEHRWWAEHLPEQPLFALDSTRLRVALEPEGPSLPVPTGDYILHGADSVRGRWLRVRLVTPSDVCVDDDSIAHRTRRVWIEYLDGRGRPRVWYRSRGC
jgi:hypothetical protein